jgi:transposase
VFGHLKINRAIATRYDQLADSFLGMLYLASARYWLKFVHAA